MKIIKNRGWTKSKTYHKGEVAKKVCIHTKRDSRIRARKIVIRFVTVVQAKAQETLTQKTSLNLYAAAATTGAAAGAAGAVSSDFSSGFDSAGAPASFAGFSRGATGVGSSILGGFSSTLAGAETSVLGLVLKKSPTRAERRRPTLVALETLSSFFSSFYI